MLDPMRHRLLLPSYVILGAVYLATYLVVPHTGVWYDGWYQPFSLAATVAILAGVIWHRPATALEALAALGCDLTQGYYIGYPQTPADIDALLKQPTGHPMPADARRP